MSDKIGGVKSIDGISIQDITNDNRKSWVNQLMEKIKDNIDGIKSSNIEYTSRNLNEVKFYVQVDSEEKHRGYKLNINKRSFSQKLYNIVNNDKYATINILEPEIETPTKIDDDIYDTEYYFVTVYYP